MLKSGSLRRHIASKMELWAEYQKKLKSQICEEDKLRAQLLEAAPESIRPLLANAGILDLLLSHGEWIGKVFLEESGFETMEEIKETFILLAEAWKGNVEVAFPENDPSVQYVDIVAVRR
jgi:hypothetical protein